MASTGDTGTDRLASGVPDDPTDNEYGSRTRNCPRCGSPLVRIRRRLIDRLLSVATGRLRRYRCYAIECGWVGNLPPRPNDIAGASRSGTGSPAAEAARQTVRQNGP